jgi:hypothetical protein
MKRIELTVDEGWQSENSPEGLPEEFQLLVWTKSVGDRVEKWDTIFWYDPQKIGIEFSSPVAGTLVEIRIPAFYSSEGERLKELDTLAGGGDLLQERLQKCDWWPRGSVAGVIETEG